MKLTRSPIASSVLHRFHDSEYIVYVEGNRDYVFWAQFGQRYGVKPKKSGGKAKCKEYARKLIDFNGRYLVCMDRDYEEFSNTLISDDRIIYTYGYSVENHVTTCSSIAKFVTLRGKGDIIKTDDVKRLVNVWHSGISELVLLDIYFHVLSSGMSGPFSNAGLDLFDSDGLSLDKVQRTVSRFKGKIDTVEYETWKNQVSASKHDVKGKFAFLLVREMINKEFKQSKCVEDDMFAFLMQSLLTGAGDYIPKSLAHLISKTELAIERLSKTVEVA